MECFKHVFKYDKRTAKNIIISLLIISSFFLGRESKQLDSLNEKQLAYLSDSFQVDSKYVEDTIYNALKTENSSDIVYRCGQSKIYHPTTSHASFKRCKSTVYELTVERAKELGMRRCRCKY